MCESWTVVGWIMFEVQWSRVPISEEGIFRVRKCLFRQGFCFCLFHDVWGILYFGYGIQLRLKKRQ